MLAGGQARLLVDTGSQVNLINLDSLDPSTDIFLNERLTITGISSTSLDSLGFFLIELWGVMTKFHVFAKPFLLPGNGILGLEFLRAEKVKLSFHHDTMVLDSNPIKPIPFLKMISITDQPETNSACAISLLPLSRKIASVENSKPLSSYVVKARTRQVISVDTIDDNIQEGYLPRINTPEGVFLDEALVSVHNGCCSVMAINTTENDVTLHIEPQELSPYDVFDEEPDD